MKFNWLDFLLTDPFQLWFVLRPLCFCRRRGEEFGRSVRSVGGGSVGCLCWRHTVRLTLLKTQLLIHHLLRLHPAAPPRPYAAPSVERGSPQPPASIATSGPSTPWTGPDPGLFLTGNLGKTGNRIIRGYKQNKTKAKQNKTRFTDKTSEQI